MKIARLALLMMGWTTACVQTQQNTDAVNYKKAREVVADLGRILAPDGVQES